MNIMTACTTDTLYVWTDPGETIRCSACELCRELLQMDHGVVVLDGASGCGKTRLLRSLREQSGVNAAVVSSETVTDELLCVCRKMDGRTMERLQALLGAYPILAVENVDCFRGKEDTQKLLGAAFRAVSAESLIVLTGYDLERTVPFLLEEIGQVRCWKAVLK